MVGALHGENGGYQDFAEKKLQAPVELRSGSIDPGGFGNGLKDHLDNSFSLMNSRRKFQVMKKALFSFLILFKVISFSLSSGVRGWESP